MDERSEFIIRCSMFNVRCWTFKKCFNLLPTSIFYSRRNGRTFPGPPIESVGLYQTKDSRDIGFEWIKNEYRMSNKESRMSKEKIKNFIIQHSLFEIRYSFLIFPNLYPSSFGEHRPLSPKWGSSRRAEGLWKTPRRGLKTIWLSRLLIFIKDAAVKTKRIGTSNIQRPTSNFE